MPDDDCIKKATTVAVIKNEIGHLTKAVEDMHLTIKELDGKFASKWVEMPVKGIVGLILTLVVSAIVGIVLAPKAFAVGQLIAMNI